MKKITISLILTVLFSCSKLDDETGGNKDGVLVNMENFVSLPTSNALIKKQISGESKNRDSQIYDVIPSASNKWYVIGEDNSNKIFGLIDENFSYSWKRVLDFYPENLESFTYLGSEYLIVIGDNNFNGGKLLLFNSNGDKLDEVDVNHTQYRVWTRSLSIIEMNSEILNFKVVGGAEKGSIYYPYLLTGQIDLSKMAFKVDFMDNTMSRVFTNSKDKLFVDIVSEQSSSYISYDSYVDGKFKGYGVLKEESLFVKWDRHLVVNSINAFSCERNGIKLSGDNIILGGAKIIEKPENNKEPKDWYTTKIYCLQKVNGSQNWLTNINKSYRSDYTTGLHTLGSKIFVIGLTAYWQEIIPDRNINFGYGYLSTLNVTTGNELNFHSFGNKLYRQGFNTLSLQGNQLNLFGFTNFKNDIKDGGYYDRWMIELDESEL